MGWTIFVNPVRLPSHSLLWMLLPLCLAVAIVYKTIRASTLERLWLKIAVLAFEIIIGLVALGVVMWLVYVLAAGSN